MASCQNIRTKIARRVKEISEFDMLIASHTGDRRFAGHIAARERINHLLAEARFIIEHIMGNAEALADAACIGNILTSQQAPLRWVAAPWS